MKKIEQPKIEAVHTDAGHFYRLPSGIVVPSVTTILGAYPKHPRLLKWIANQGSHDAGQAKLKAAGDKGTAVHDAIVHILEEKPLPRTEYSPEEMNCISAFRKWYGQYFPRIEWTERKIYSEIYGYAGTADLLCKIKQAYWLIDHKTSSGIWNSYTLQLTAYAHALHEMGQTVSHLGILRLDKKTGEYEWKTFLFSKSEFQTFLACYEMWKHSTDIKIPT